MTYIKCANCNNTAIYTAVDSGVNPVDYCNACLPKHLKERANAGHFPLANSKPEETPVEEKKSKDEDNTK